MFLREKASIPKPLKSLASPKKKTDIVFCFSILKPLESLAPPKKCSVSEKSFLPHLLLKK
jgi:hypothetical protein